MRRLIIILLAVLILPSQLCKAQTQSNWDEALDRYELLCQRCLELMEQQKNGADIPRESLSSLVTQLSLLKNTLSDARGSMTAAQKSRFDLIRRKFSGSGATAEQKKKQTKETKPQQSRPMPGAINEKPRPETKETTAIESKAVARSVGETLTTVNDHPDAEAEIQSISDKVIIKSTASAARTAKHEKHILAALQAGVFPDMSYGGLTGATIGKFGTYLKFRDDFAAAGEASKYTCNISGVTPEGNIIWSDGTERKSRMAATAGAIWQPWKHLAFYAGAGYGSRHYDMRDIDGNWARVSDLSADGFCIDFGAFCMFGKHIFAGAGANTTAFRYTDLEITFGVRF